MSIAQAAAKAMLSDALLRDDSGIHRISHLELELPLDKVIKFVSVGLPLMLVCMAFAREISLGEQLFLSGHLFCIPFAFALNYTLMNIIGLFFLHALIGFCGPCFSIVNSPPCTLILYFLFLNVFLFICI